MEIFRPGLLGKMTGRVPVGTAVVHVDVKITAVPPGGWHVRQALEPKLDYGGSAGGDRDGPPVDPILRTPRDFYAHVSGRNGQPRRASRVKVAIFQRPLLRIEAVIGVAPGVIRGVAPPVAPRDRDPGGTAVSAGIHDAEAECSYRPEVGSTLGGDPRHPATRELNNPKPGISALIADVRDARAVGRPTRCGGVALAVGKLEGIGPVGGHQPELVPLSAEVRAVDHPLAVAAPVGPSLPGSLFVAELARLGTRRCGHAPEPARAPDVSPIGNEDQLLPIRTPRGGEILVIGIVVVAGKPAQGIGRDPLGRAK